MGDSWRVLFTKAGTQLCDFLDTNVEGHQLLSDNALRHAPAQVITRSRTICSSENVKLWNITPSPIEGRQCVDCGPETVGV
jgi:hypothetical protein